MDESASENQCIAELLKLFCFEDILEIREESNCTYSVSYDYGSKTQIQFKIATLATKYSFFGDLN